MNENLLPLPDGYSPENQRMVAIFAAQLDMQLDRLKQAVQGLTVEQLQWQMRTGMNTVGMLLAHISIAEIFWMRIAPKEIHDTDEWDRIVKELIGIQGHEDGMPLQKDGKHPSTLAGKTIDDYLKMLDIGRETTHSILKTWKDDDLELTFIVKKDNRFSRLWALYHVLEHLAGHMGQILILKHIMGDEGVLTEAG